MQRPSNKIIKKNVVIIFFFTDVKREASDNIKISGPMQFGQIRGLVSW